MTKQFTTAACAVGLAALVAAPLQARPADCLLAVGGQTYIAGSCDIIPLDDELGSFQIISTDLSYFAYLYVEGADAASAFWNETAGASHAHTPLGALTRDGACWVNAAARICASLDQ